MSATTLVSPELEQAIEPRNDAGHLPPHDVIGGAQSAMPVSLNAEIQKLDEGQLKSAILIAWKKHEALAKAELAPLLYWLREKLRAQGARNDLVRDKDRGWEVWVTEHLDISRRTADRWCAWYAEKEGLTPPDTCPEVDTEIVDTEIWEDIIDQHKGQQQIAFNCWVGKSVHAQFTKALTTIQKKFGLKDNKKALVRGVIYAANIIGTKGRGSAKAGGVSIRKSRPKTNRHRAQV